MSCKYKQFAVRVKSDRNYNIDWQFGMFKRGRANRHDTWFCLI